MVGTLQGFVNYELAIAKNDAYRYGSWDCSDRCNPERSGCADCSGLVCAALRNQGVDVGCLGSFELARICYSKGGLIPTGVNEYGSLLFMGINQGRGGIPGVDPGHVGTDLGNGYVVHALSHKWGILVTPKSWVNWSGHYRNVWLTGAPPKPPIVVPKGRKLIVLVRNLDGHLEEFRIVGGACAHRWQTSPGGPWSNYASLGGTNLVSIDGTLGPDNHVVICAVDSANAVKYNRQQPSGAWTGWH